MASRSDSPSSMSMFNAGRPTMSPSSTSMVSASYDALVGKMDGGVSERPCLLAVPKKGRLAEKILKILEGAGLDYVRPNRLDVGKCKMLPLLIVFLPAADIARYVSSGNVDLGITGLDIIHESEADVDILLKLNLGKCKLAVQAPIGTIKDISELAGKRVVTSFPNLTTKYFGQFGGVPKVQYVSGSVEVACALGLADCIVDLVETGTTMRAAGLEIVTTVMDTETVLIKNKHTSNDPLVSIIQKRIEGYILAQENSMLTYNIPRAALAEAVKITPGAKSPTVSPLEDKEWVSVTVLTKTAEMSHIMDRLQAIGAESLIVFEVSNCRA